MILSNPFAELSALIPPGVMQAYVVLMVLFVIGGTLLDILHKQSAKYFAERGRSLKKLATRDVGSAEKLGIAATTLANEVLASGEFDNPERRKSHLLMMYGFIIFVVTTALLIFGLPHEGGGGALLLSLLWHVGAVMICVGGYWFWLKLRVDVRCEGHEWYEVDRRDLFIVSLLAMATFALVWSFLEALGGGVLAGLAAFLFIVAATTLFTTVFWSKFAHMFYKPAAAFQKKVAKADGSRDKLPDLPELTDPVVRERYPDIPEYMGENPPYMGLGIKREAPTHY